MMLAHSKHSSRSVFLCALLWHPCLCCNPCMCSICRRLTTATAMEDLNSPWTHNLSKSFSLLSPQPLNTETEIYKHYLKRWWFVGTCHVLIFTFSKAFALWLCSALHPTLPPLLLSLHPLLCPSSLSASLPPLIFCCFIHKHAHVRTYHTPSHKGKCTASVRDEDDPSLPPAKKRRVVKDASSKEESKSDPKVKKGVKPSSVSIPKSMPLATKASSSSDSSSSSSSSESKKKAKSSSPSSSSSAQHRYVLY